MRCFTGRTERDLWWLLDWLHSWRVSCAVVYLFKEVRVVLHQKVGRLYFMLHWLVFIRDQYFTYWLELLTLFSSISFWKLVRFRTCVNHTFCRHVQLTSRSSLDKSTLLRYLRLRMSRNLLLLFRHWFLLLKKLAKLSQWTHFARLFLRWSSEGIVFIFLQNVLEIRLVWWSHRFLYIVRMHPFAFLNW